MVDTIYEDIYRELVKYQKDFYPEDESTYSPDFLASWLDNSEVVQTENEPEYYGLVTIS